MVLASLALISIQQKLVPIAKLDSPMIDEMSGIAKSRRFPDTYWVHNDSGDSARIFAIHSNGKLIYPPGNKYEGLGIDSANNFDWEDIAIEGDTLYVGDCGDNLNFRPSEAVYVFKEPDPTKTTLVKDVKKISFVYPDKTSTTPWHFDCEGLAVRRGVLYFVTKWRKERSNHADVGASIYKLANPSFTATNTLKKLDTKEDLGGWVTAADISLDGKTLAILTQAPVQSVWLFDMTKGDDIFHHPLRQIKFTGGKQCEALCWDSAKSLIIGNEQSDLYRLNL